MENNLNRIIGLTFLVVTDVLLNGYNWAKFDLCDRIRAMNKAQFLPASADSLARAHTAEAVGVLVQTMRGTLKVKIKGELVELPVTAKERIAAARDLLDRGHGRAVQATIAVPARHALAQRLTNMSDAELLQIAKSTGRGEYPPNAVPTGRGDTGGSHAEGAEPYANTNEHGNDDDVPEAMRNEDIVDGEIEIDPCS